MSVDGGDTSLIQRHQDKNNSDIFEEGSVLTGKEDMISRVFNCELERQKFFSLICPVETRGTNQDIGVRLRGGFDPDSN